MCYAAAIPAIMAAVTAASTAYSIDTQNKQTAYQNDVNEMNTDAANKANAENYRLQSHQLGLQELQDNEQAAQLKQQQLLAVQKEVATQRVSAGEAGVSGLSIDSIFADVIRQGANNMTTIDNNLADNQAQRDVERRLLQNQTTANTQVNTSYSSGSKGLGAGLQIIGAGLSGYTSAGGTFGSSSTPARSTVGFRSGVGQGR